jgi:hypothetical protein
VAVSRSCDGCTAFAPTRCGSSATAIAREGFKPVCRRRTESVCGAGTG